jgi:hypothetical protein
MAGYPSATNLGGKARITEALERKAERMPFTVTGRNSEEAIERAIKEYEVPERERFRISVQREA